MTLKPIPGAPPGAPIPEFPTGEPSSLVVPAAPFDREPVAPSTNSLSQTESVSPSPAHPPGPVEIRGDGDCILTFRCIPEVPAINRSSMTISITGEPTGDYSPRAMPHLNLAIDEARAFLLALRDGKSPFVFVDNRTAIQVEFTIADEGPRFCVSKQGQQHTLRRFNAGWTCNVQAMAAHLLAELGP